MTNFSTIISNNRANSRALKVADFDNAETYKAWRDTVEKVSINISNYAVYVRTDGEKGNKTAIVDEFFAAYKTVLNFFTQDGGQFRLHAESNDLETILSLAGHYTKAKGADQKEYIPVSAISFRKAIEDFCADRFNAADCKCAAEIEREKAERRAKRAEARKAAKKANNK